MIAALVLLMAAQSGPCADAVTQTDLNLCSMKEYEAADAELNAAWRDLRDIAKRRGMSGSLLDAQRAWIAFRDAHCETVAARYAGGSIAPLIANRCMTELTEARSAQLRELAETN